MYFLVKLHAFFVRLALWFGDIYSQEMSSMFLISGYHLCAVLGFCQNLSVVNTCLLCTTSPYFGVYKCNYKRKQKVVGVILVSSRYGQQEKQLSRA